MMSTVGRVVDLSQVINADTQIYPGDPTPSLTPAATLDGDGVNVLHVVMGSHTGTHVDAPYHFLADGARIDQLDLGLFLGSATVADVQGLPARSRIGWAHLEPYADELAPGRILLVHTGWSRHWCTPTYHDHPYLDPDAAARIVATGVRTVGIDAMSVDETPAQGGAAATYPAHHVLLGAGGVIVENLTNLESIDFVSPVVSVLPIRLDDADGAPVRAVALESLAPRA
jgi:kynurenine formamidase